MLMDMKNLLQQFNADGISAKRYLGYEQRMQRWIQISAEEAAFMEEGRGNKGFRIQQVWQFC